MSSDYESSQKRLDEGSQQPTISSRIQNKAQEPQQSKSGPKNNSTVSDDDGKYTSIEQTINSKDQLKKTESASIEIKEKQKNFSLPQDIDSEIPDDNESTYGEKKDKSIEESIIEDEIEND